ncbi:MAG: hypothetical protein JWO31_2161 [Phycisphaerales bacterium]|nr:hypothetical protein [Phycisphaerales bacterium]
MPGQDPHTPPPRRRMTDDERAAVVRLVRFRQMRSACYLLAAVFLGAFVATGRPAVAGAAVGIILVPHVRAAQSSGGRVWGMSSSYAGLRGWSLVLAQLADAFVLTAITVAVANVVDGHRVGFTLLAGGLMLVAVAVRRLGIWRTFG